MTLGSASIAAESAPPGITTELQIDSKDKKGQKFSKSARKWIEKCMDSWTQHGGPMDDLPFWCPGEEGSDGKVCDGFLVLNGGPLASRSSFEVRELLCQEKYLQSRHLNFVNVNYLFKVSADSQEKVSRTIPVFLVPISERLRSVHQGCSNSMGEALLLTPCQCNPVVQLLGHMFQPAVIGHEHLLLNCERKLQRSADTQRVLISSQIDLIPGLYVIRDFITSEEHDTISQELEDRGQFKLQYLQRRKVVHFNRRFVYGVNEVDKVGCEVNPNPDFFNTLQLRLHNKDPSAQISGPLPDFGERLCDQLTVNYYDYSGTTGRSCGIASHVDAHSAFMNQIFIVSLGSYTVMEFRRWDLPSKSAAIPVYLEPRSLVILSDEVRYGWEHAIAERRTDALTEWLPSFHRGGRVSLTWRVARDSVHHKASCQWPALCDGV